MLFPCGQCLHVVILPLVIQFAVHPLTSFKLCMSFPRFLLPALYSVCPSFLYMYALLAVFERLNCKLICPSVDAGILDGVETCTVSFEQPTLPVMHFKPRLLMSGASRSKIYSAQGVNVQGFMESLTPLFLLLLLLLLFLLPRHFPYLRSAHHVFILKVLRSCHSSISSPISFVTCVHHLSASDLAMLYTLYLLV